jgi:hypothetical protein
MEFCTGCGNRLGVGRFCTNCGRPIPPETPSADTAERPAVPVPTTPPPSLPPPPAYTPPPKPRFPLYADQAPGPPSPTYQPPPAPAPSGDRRPPWLPLALTVLLVLLMAVAGGLLLLSGGGDEERAEDPAPANGTAKNENSPPADASPKAPPPSTSPPPPPPADGPQDLARYAIATAPKTAKPNLDTQGNLVRYEAANMLDGVAPTCWRMPGDGSGGEIVFTLSGPSELTEVGLINGYAKRSGRLDWYSGNRKVLAVEWVFDDGTVVPQSFSENREMQSMPIPPVTTSRVLLRLVSVGEPGKGPSARNYTAISDVRLFGEPV